MNFFSNRNVKKQKIDQFLYGIKINLSNFNKVVAKFSVNQKIFLHQQKMSSVRDNKILQANQQVNPSQKSQRMILSFNKNGLQALTNEKTQSQAFDYFKKAQKTVLEELKIQPQSIKLNQLAAVTYNNLACYYKKTNKPKVSLTYLKKALEIQVFKVQNWLSTASTHLNICAIYSYINKHQQACEHALLAIKMLQKWQTQQLIKKQPQDQVKTYHNVKMLSNYNAGIQHQHLKKYEEAINYYQQTILLASQNQQKNGPLIKSCQQAKERVQNLNKNQKQKLIQILTKRKQHQQKNNYEFMRKNKKNFPKDGQSWRDLVHNRKYAEYKIQTQHQSQSQFNTKKHQSVGRLTAIRPVLHADQPSSRNLHSQNKTVQMKIKKKQ